MATPTVPRLGTARPSFGRHSTQMTCPNCNFEIWTRTETKQSIWAWLAGGALCLVGYEWKLDKIYINQTIFIILFFNFFFSCCCLSCIPCCLEDFKETKHFCPKCNALLGEAKLRLWIFDAGFFFLADRNLIKLIVT